jgi:hypothetical protein
VKWNGASFWLGLLGLELLAGRWRRWRISGSWQATPLPWRTGVMYLGLVPLLTYGLLWIPHLGLNEVSLIEVHRQLWGFHQSLASGVEVHPYCSAWYTWPLMVRPVAYFYDSVNAIPQQNILAPLASTGITTYTVQAMGNPMLWWLSTAAMVALMGSQGARFYQSWRSPTTVDQLSHPVVLFVLVNYGANWLPWAMVQRCTFSLPCPGNGALWRTGPGLVMLPLVDDRHPHPSGSDPGDVGHHWPGVLVLATAISGVAPVARSPATPLVVKILDLAAIQERRYPISVLAFRVGARLPRQSGDFLFHRSP